VKNERMGEWEKASKREIEKARKRCGRGLHCVYWLVLSICVIR